MRSKIRDSLLISTPAIWFIPLLDSLIPIYFHRPREIAGYFASLAFVREPIQSFFYLTPAESYASLHFHSILSAPLIAVGYHEGGRFISLIAVVATAIILYLLAHDLTNSQFVGIVAGGTLWSIPFMQRFAYTFQPETLSIALTTGVVYASYRQVRDEPTWAWPASLLLLILAIATHRWEALIIAPVIVLYLKARDYQRAVITATVAIVMVGIVGLIVNLQPSNPSQLMGYAIHNQDPLFFQIDWWFAHLPHPDKPLTTFHVIVTALLPVTFIASLVWGVKFIRTYDTTAGLLFSWHASAMTIPFLFPGGFPAHEYYLWATVAPLSLSIAICIGRTSRAIPVSLPFNAQEMTLFIVLISAGLTGTQVMANEYGSLDRDTPPRAFMNGLHEYESFGAGERVSRYQSESLSIAFIGEEFRDHTSDNYAHDHGRVLVYSDVLVRERAPGQPNGRVVYVDNVTNVGGCTMYVKRVGRGLITDRCAELNHSG